uniref:S100/CaBP-9k-type calcium binding subdomain domain-containing protein n=2 Tax=Monopterus albus TaxID=43700 RepID=A0A3Q3QCK4_MONAL
MSTSYHTCNQSIWSVHTICNSYFCITLRFIFVRVRQYPSVLRMQSCSGVRGGEQSGLGSSVTDRPAERCTAASTPPPSAGYSIKPAPQLSLCFLDTQFLPGRQWRGEKTMTDLESSMATIIAVFRKYSEREGDKHKLKKNELKDLFQDELPDLMAHVKDQGALDSLMESLDTDGDAECDFQEFMTFVSMVTICCHEFFEHEDE